jgi:hypothetical protein
MLKNNHNIKIVRLQSGEDIIAEYEVDIETDFAILTRPMQVFFKRLNSGKSVLMTMPWIPLELVEDNICYVELQNVLTTFEPRIELKNYYTKAAIEADQLIGDETVGESLNVFDADQTDETLFDDGDELEPDEEDEVLEVSNVAAKRYLH